uniref:Conserved oligomeric Golgi complex subunit 5 n=1 Tax=Strigamia maritima TaxID=126957 RepID=T1IMS2_STRMM
MEMMETSSALGKLEQDDVFSQFLKPEFLVKNFASQSLQGALVSELLPKLASGIALLDKELLNHVSTHYEDLLSQATGIETLEGVLSMMHVRIQNLLSAVERLKMKLFEPYKKISSHTAMLARLQTVCDLLRQIVRVIYLTKRLHGQLQAGPQEITKVAQSLSELDCILKTGNLDGMEAIEKEQQLIRQSRKEVERQAELMLNRGIETPNQSQIAIALQVFHNLGLLERTVRKTIENLQNQLTDAVKDALSLRNLSESKAFKGGPGRSSLPSVGSTVAFRANLWTNMEKLTNQIYLCCSRALHLQKVLVKKRDPLSQICFMEELINVGGDNILPVFWQFVTRILKEEFNNAAIESTAIKQAFEGEYPKLLRNFADLWKKLQHLTSNSQQEMDELSNEFDPELALRSTLHQFEQAYLSRSLSRLFDPINIVFGSEGATPRAEDVNEITRIVSSELGFALVDAELYKTVAKNVAKTVNLFAVKWEQMVCTDGEASQVICPVTPGQKLNVEIVNLLNYFNTQMKLVVSSLVNPPPAACEIILHSLDSTTALMASITHPLIKSIRESIEDVILTMHNEDYSTNSTNSTISAPCSLYMKELEQFIIRAHSQYLCQFEADDFTVTLLHPLAARSIDFLVRHMTQVRPLGSYGKMRLASDLAQMELAISPLCRRVSELGKSYRLLRCLKTLLFQNAEHIQFSPSLPDIIPYSTVLNFLFSKAPNEMLSPHQNAHWSIARYSQWLDEHTEKEALHLIQGTLEAYARSVKERREKEYSSVYPIMLHLLQKGLENK